MEPYPLPPQHPQANDLLCEQMNQNDNAPNVLLPENGEDNGTRNSAWEAQSYIVSLAPAQPRPWIQNLIKFRRQFINQILGLNLVKGSYFALYRPAKDFQTRTILVLGIVLAIAAGVPLPLIGLVFGKIINNFPPNEDELRTRLTQLMGIAVAYFAVTWAWSLCWGIVGERVSRRLRESLVERAIGMEMSYFDTETPEMTSILTEKTQIIQLGTSEKVGVFIASISYFVAAFIVGFILNAKLTGIILASVIPSMTLIVYFGTKFVSNFSKLSASFTEEAATVAESALRAVQVVQAFGISEQLAQDHVKFLRSALRAGIRKGIFGALMLGSVWFVAYAVNALAFWEGNRLRKESGDPRAEAGTIYAVVFLILDASFVVGQVGPFLQTFAMAAAAGQSVFEILDHQASDIDVYSKTGKYVEKLNFSKSLQLRDVSFVYPARQNVRVLGGLNLTFKPGMVTGIVGPSGSGKSTIAALLLRLYDPSAGQVMLGDEDIKNFNIASLRSNISLVTQEPILFTGTILDNIKHGLPAGYSLSEEEVLDRCKAAAADARCDFIDKLPDGIHTKLGAGHNSQLSGGQKQRISLARALIRNPSLLILDEYTSAMDATNEAAVLEALKRTSAERTTIVIAHRLVTVKDADEIVVMKDGAVVEQGDHEELMDLNGVYSDLIKAQQFEKKKTSSASASLHSSGRSLPIDEAILKSTNEEKGGMNSALPKPKKREMNAAQLLGRCLKLGRPESPIILFGLLCSMISGGVIIGEAIIFGNLVELLNDTSRSGLLDAKVQFFCLMFFVLALVAIFGHTCSGSAFGFVSENLITRARDISFRTILSQDIAWFAEDEHSHHALMAKLNMDSSSLSGLSGVILGTLVSITTSVLGGIILAHILAWKIAIVLLAAVPVMLVAGFLRLRILANAERRHQTAYNAAAALASEACSAIKTVAALGREENVLRLYREAIQKPYQESLGFIVWGNVLLAFSLSVTYFVYALAYWWGSKQVRNGNYGQREFFTVLPALLFSAQAAGQMFSLAPEMTRAKMGAQSVFQLHDEKPTIMTKLDTRPSLREKKFDEKLASNAMYSTKSLLEFRDVSLHYGNRREVAAVRNASFSIRSGEIVAFVGRSGAGKSSTISLIERFYDPTTGSVLLHGKDIRYESVQTHRARLGLVEQEPDLFPGSIRFNISLGACPGTTVELEDIIKVSRRCGLHDFIMSLPEGYNTECGSHGSRLSGGQRQRVAIARALIRDPEILLLDEATSQLDANTEKEVRSAISAASSGRTTIMIAHRLASVQHADRIFVFDSGSIVEEGKHDELVAMNGIYAGMVAAQELD